MHNKKSYLVLFGAVVIVALMLPLAGFALTTPMPPVCQNHAPAGNPSHSCCHPGHASPMATRTVSSSIRTAEIVQQVVTATHAKKLKTSVVRSDETDSSPPNLAVLRI